MRREPVFAALASAQLSNSQRIFVPAKYVLMGKPQVSRSASLPQVLLQVGADLRRARVQPHDGARCRFPDLASHATTVCAGRDAHARDVGGGRAARNLGQRARHALVRVRHDLLGVVLAPTGLGEDLLVLHPMRRHGGELRARGRLDPAYESRGRRALVQRAHQRGGMLFRVVGSRPRASGVSSTRDDRACLREGRDGPMCADADLQRKDEKTTTCSFRVGRAKTDATRRVAYPVRKAALPWVVRVIFLRAERFTAASPPPSSASASPPRPRSRPPSPGPSPETAGPRPVFGSRRLAAAAGREPPSPPSPPAGTASPAASPPPGTPTGTPTGTLTAGAATSARLRGRDSRRGRRGRRARTKTETPKAVRFPRRFPRRLATLRDPRAFPSPSFRLAIRDRRTRRGRPRGRHPASYRCLSPRAGLFCSPDRPGPPRTRGARRAARRRMRRRIRNRTPIRRRRARLFRRRRRAAYARRRAASSAVSCFRSSTASAVSMNAKRPGFFFRVSRRVARRISSRSSASASGTGTSTPSAPFLRGRRRSTRPSRNAAWCSSRRIARDASARFSLISPRCCSSHLFSSAARCLGSEARRAASSSRRRASKSSLLIVSPDAASTGRYTHRFEASSRTRRRVLPSTTTVSSGAPRPPRPGAIALGGR